MLRAIAVDAVRDADDGVHVVAGLAGELAEASGLTGDDDLKAARSAARERGYAALDGPYRRWLARLSSQAWKRATRRDFKAYLPHSDLGVRTRRIVAEIVDRISHIDATIDRAEAVVAAVAVLKAAKLTVKDPRGRVKGRRDPGVAA